MNDDNDDLSNLTEKERSKIRTFSETLMVTLKAFERAREWADVMKALDKLENVLRKFSLYPHLPHRFLLSKRIAQALGPNLPGGVHSKAVDIVDFLCEKIGPESLSRDLHLYAIGIFPLFRLTSMQVKPKILSLVEKRFLPLKKALIPSLNGLITCLLPGIEDVSSEYYKRVFSLLVRLENEVGREQFFRSLWSSIARVPFSRVPAFRYIRETIPKVIPSEVDKREEFYNQYFPSYSTLVLPALGQALTDDQVLVQRDTIDVISAFFKVSYNPTKEKDQNELQWTDLKTLPFEFDSVDLIFNLLPLLSRKEASLNRRLFLFFEGEIDESHSATEQAEYHKNYFLAFTKRPLVLALEKMFSSHPSTVKEVGCVFSVLFRLLERDQLSSLILDDIIPLLLAFLYKLKDNKAFSDELVKQFNEFLSYIELEHFFTLLGKILLDYIRSASRSNDCDLISYIDHVLDIMMIECLEDKNDILNIHFPNFLAIIVSSTKISFESKYFNELNRCYKLALKVIGKIPPIDTNDPNSLSSNNLPRHDSVLSAFTITGDTFSRLSMLLCSNETFEYTSSLDSDSFEVVSNAPLSASSARFDSILLRCLTSASSVLGALSHCFGPNGTFLDSKIIAEEVSIEQNGKVNEAEFENDGDDEEEAETENKNSVSDEKSDEEIDRLLTDSPRTTCFRVDAPSTETEPIEPESMKSKAKPKRKHTRNSSFPLLGRTPKWFAKGIENCFEKTSNPVHICVMIRTVLSLFSSINPKESYYWRSIISESLKRRIVNKLWSFLSVQFSYLHSDVTELFFLIEKHFYKSLYSELQILLSPNDPSFTMNLNYLGLLWRLLGENIVFSSNEIEDLRNTKTENGTESCEKSSTEKISLFSFLHLANLFEIEGENDTKLATNDIVRIRNVALENKELLNDVLITPFNRPFVHVLYVLYKALLSENPNLSLIGKTWFTDSITKTERIIDPVFLELLLPFNTRSAVYEMQSSKILFTLKVLKTILNQNFRYFLDVFHKSPSKDLVLMNDSIHSVFETPKYIMRSEKVTYLDLLVDSLMRFFHQTTVEIIPIQISVAELLSSLLSVLTLSEAKDITILIQNHIFSVLAISVNGSFLGLQVALLSLVNFIVLLEQFNPEKNVESYLTMFGQTLLSALLQQNAVRFYWLELFNTCVRCSSKAISLSLSFVFDCFFDILSPDNRKMTIQDYTLTMDTLGRLVDFCLPLPKTIEVVPNSNIVLDFLSYSMKPFLQLSRTVRSGTVNSGNENESEIDSQRETRTNILVSKLLNIVTLLFEQFKLTSSTNSNQLFSDKLSNRFIIQDKIFIIFDKIFVNFPLKVIEAIIEVFPKIENEKKNIINVFNHSENSNPEKVFLSCSNAINNHNYETVLDFINEFCSSYCSVEEMANGTQSFLILMKQFYQLLTLMSLPIFVKCANSFFSRVNVFETRTKVVLSSSQKRERVDFVAKICDMVYALCFKSLRKSSRSSMSYSDLAFSWNRPYMALSGVEKGSNKGKKTKMQKEATNEKENDKEKEDEKEKENVKEKEKEKEKETSNDEKLDSDPSEIYHEDVLSSDQDISEIALNSVDSSNSIPISNGISSEDYISNLSDEQSDGKLVSKSSSEQSIPIKKDPMNGIAQKYIDLLKLLGKCLLPLLDMVDDKERPSVTMLSVIVHALIPIITHKKKTSARLVVAALKFIRKTTNYPSFTSCWRKELYSYFLLENDFFNVQSEKALSIWMSIVNCMMICDKSLFSEFLKHCHRAFGPSFFVTQEDILNKAKNLKRLSFVLLSGEMNQHIKSQNIVLDRLSELSKTVEDPLVTTQIFLCLRVMFCRFSISTNFLNEYWIPIIVQLIASLSKPVASVSSSVVLSATKLIDCVLEIPELNLQLHDWIFISNVPSSPSKQSIIPPSSSSQPFIPLLDRFGLFNEELNDQIEPNTETLPTTNATAEEYNRFRVLLARHLMSKQRDKGGRKPPIFAQDEQNMISAKKKANLHSLLVDFLENTISSPSSENEPTYTRHSLV